MLLEIIRRHVSLPEPAALTVALWVLHCHVLDAFSTSPRLVISSTEAGSGKTTLITLLSLLVPRPLDFCGGASKAVLWSLGYRPTLLIDDAPALIDGNSDMRAILQNGAQRIGARLLRPAKDHAEAVDIFVPVALAISGPIPPSLTGRAIEIRLDRLSPGETLRPIDPEAEAEIAQVRGKIARWAADAIRPLRAIATDHAIAPVWRPLLATAAQAGPEWHARARAAMESLSSTAAPQTFDKLLRDIRELLDQLAAGELLLRTRDGRHITDTNLISSSHLARLLINYDENSWGKWGKAKMPITGANLASLLTAAKIHRGMLRFHTVLSDGTPAAGFTDRGYKREQFTDAFAKLADNDVPDAA